MGQIRDLGALPPPFPQFGAPHPPLLPHEKNAQRGDPYRDFFSAEMTPLFGSRGRGSEMSRERAQEPQLSSLTVEIKCELHGTNSEIDCPTDTETRSSKAN